MTASTVASGTRRVRSSTPNALAIVRGTAAVEARMQLRRRGLWITFALCSLVVLTGARNPWSFDATVPAKDVLTGWATLVNSVFPIIVGCLLADRARRSIRLGVVELLDATAARPRDRLVGTYLGATAATLVPYLLVYASGVGYVVLDRGEPAAVVVAAAIFLAVCLPGLLFVAAFSVAVPLIMWGPLYQFLFTGYWFWGNLLNPAWAIPTLSGTWLTPVGDTAAAGLFDGDGLWVAHAATWEALASIFLLIVTAGLALWAGAAIETRRAATR